MPHVSFVCPDPEIEAEPKIAACLDCSRTRLFRSCDYNYPLLTLMVERPDERVSPTRLQQCPRQVAIKRRHDYTVDPKDAWARVRGTLMHVGLATLGEGGTEQGELELTRDLDGVEIAGRVDLIAPEQGLITDWKTTAYIRKDHAPRDSHIGQLSVYAWLAAGRGWACQYGELLYMDMRRPKRYVVQLWEAARVEGWIRRRLGPLQRAYDAQAPLAKVLVEGEDADFGQCGYCTVGKLCKTLHEEGQ